jgi:hypothetical protein
MEKIPLETLASGDSAEPYTFILLTENGRGFYEIKIADAKGEPLAPRLRIENVGGSLRLFVWDVTAQDSTGSHPPGYSLQRELVTAGRPDPPRRSDSMVLAHAPNSSP